MPIGAERERDGAIEQRAQWLELTEDLWCKTLREHGREREVRRVLNDPPHTSHTRVEQSAFSVLHGADSSRPSRAVRVHFAQ
jgi:hypothetical protein